jgi:hypothetical protein
MQHTPFSIAYERGWVTPAKAIVQTFIVQHALHALACWPEKLQGLGVV